jgi:glutamate-1-semialdehyde 2,1-aminomutase/spore coat polysaccharide biosynthesis protein SpsF
MLRTEPVLDTIWATGDALRAGLQRLAAGVAFDVRMVGDPSRSALTFAPSAGAPPSELLRGLFLQECHKRGVLFGVPIFPTYRHDGGDVARTLDAVEAAYALMDAAHADGDYEGRLEGRPPGSVFRTH